MPAFILYPPTRTFWARQPPAPRRWGTHGYSGPFIHRYDERTLGYFSAACGSSRIASSAHHEWPSLDTPFAPRRWGTHGYMAPEVLRGESYSTAVDLFSVGKRVPDT
jgi:serine/threonine protein kinase